MTQGRHLQMIRRRVEGGPVPARAAVLRHAHCAVALEAQAPSICIHPLSLPTLSVECIKGHKDVQEVNSAPETRVVRHKAKRP